MAWRVARSLDRLLTQLNTLAPNRSKVSDGSIGDAAHASRTSDHNPWVVLGGMGIVTARDFTHDPGRGLDCEALYCALVASRDPRIKYIIWNRTITSGNGQTQPWVRRPYTGTNAHTQHLHLSVHSSSGLFDDTRDWAIGGGAAPSAPKADPNDDFLTLGDSGAAVVALQEVLNRFYPKLSPLSTDGEFGPATLDRVKYYQRAAGLTADGEVGPGTRKGLGLKPPAEYASVTPATPATPAMNPNGGLARFYNGLPADVRAGLGEVVSPEFKLGELDAYAVVLANGIIYWSPQYGSCLVRGAILAAYAAAGYQNSSLGLPVSSEFSYTTYGPANAEPIGRWQTNFEHGFIQWDEVVGTTVFQ